MAPSAFTYLSVAGPFSAISMIMPSSIVMVAFSKICVGRTAVELMIEKIVMVEHLLDVVAEVFGRRARC